MKLIEWGTYILLGVLHISMMSFLFPIHNILLFVLTVLVLIVIYLRGAIKGQVRWIYVGVIVYGLYLATNSLLLAPPTIERTDTDTYSYSSKDLFDR